jgi:transcriptional regulator with XRE-family HTH domain
VTSAEFRTELAKLGISQRRFATYTGSNERTVRRWALGDQDIPPWVPVILRDTIWWRPIDTVPAETNLILGWNGEQVGEAFRGVGRWFMTNSCSGPHPEPTHWMPLPGPPVLTA